MFVTNNSSAIVAAQEAALSAIGIPAVGDVLTSAMAAAALVREGERVLVCGGPGVAEAVISRGATAVAGDDPTGVDVDAVLVGFHREFDYERMRIAATAVRRGSRLIATNDDATYPTPAGPIPGGGAILASIATASGRQPVVAGKPYEPMATAVSALLGGPAGSSRDVRSFGSRLLMVGDRASTDGAFAVTLGCPFGLVRTGPARCRARLGSINVLLRVRVRVRNSSCVLSIKPEHAKLRRAAFELQVKEKPQTEGLLEHLEAAANKCLARSNKPRTRAEATNPAGEARRNFTFAPMLAAPPFPHCQVHAPLSSVWRAQVAQNLWIVI